MLQGSGADAPVPVPLRLADSILTHQGVKGGTEYGPQHLRLAASPGRVHGGIGSGLQSVSPGPLPRDRLLRKVNDDPRKSHACTVRLSSCIVTEVGIPASCHASHKQTAILLDQRSPASCGHFRSLCSRLWNTSNCQLHHSASSRC